MQRMSIGDAQYTERLAAREIRCQRNCSILRIVQKTVPYVFCVFTIQSYHTTQESYLTIFPNQNIIKN
jgi:hypothetical protein